MIQPKSWEVVFIRWEFLGLENLGGSISSNSERTTQKRWKSEARTPEKFYMEGDNPNLKNIVN